MFWTWYNNACPSLSTVIHRWVKTGIKYVFLSQYTTNPKWRLQTLVWILLSLMSALLRCNSIDFSGITLSTCANENKIRPRVSLVPQVTTGYWNAQSLAKLLWTSEQHWVFKDGVHIHNSVCISFHSYPFSFELLVLKSLGDLVENYSPATEFYRRLKKNP